MNRISILSLLLLLSSLHCLRLHTHMTQHFYAESPSELEDLSEDETAIQSKLALVNLQLAAVNNTIASNMYVPNWETESLTLLDLSKDLSFDPQSTSQLCIVFN